MQNSPAELLNAIIQIYKQQMELYRQLHELTLMEKEAIEAENRLTLTELLHLEDQLIAQVRKLEENQRGLREVFLQAVPIQRIDIEQLACLVAPEIYVSLQRVLVDIKGLLGNIEMQKNENVVLLENSLCKLN